MSINIKVGLDLGELGEADADFGSVLLVGCVLLCFLEGFADFLGDFGHGVCFMYQAFESGE